MHFRKCFGYAAYPLLAALLFVPSALRAQDAPQQQTTAPQTNPPTTMDESQQTTPEQRAQVLREAQERVNARRKLRIEQIIKDTYSHKYELDFGGDSLRFRPGQYLEFMNEAGWHVDVTDYLRGNLGIAVDARGYYGTAYTGSHVYSGLNQAYNPSISQYVFLAGPRYRFFRGQHWGWTAQVLAGVGHGNFGTGTYGLPPQLVGLYTDSTVLNIAPGASVDYNLSPALAIRWSAVDLMTNYGSNFQDKNLGGSMGIVYRLGRK